MLQISKTQINNKKKANQNPLLNLLINCISQRSAHQILSIKDKRTFPFPNFLVNGLCNSSANYWFGIISLLTASPEVFLLKNL